MSDIEQRIYDNWGSIWTANHRRKDHINPNCEHMTAEDYRKKDMELYTPAHLDVCAGCKDYFREWERGFRESDYTTGCNRCGQTIGEGQDYCSSCSDVSAWRKARREL